MSNRLSPSFEEQIERHAAGRRRILLAPRASSGEYWVLQDTEHSQPSDWRLATCERRQGEDALTAVQRCAEEILGARLRTVIPLDVNRPPDSAACFTGWLADAGPRLPGVALVSESDVRRAGGTSIVGRVLGSTRAREVVPHLIVMETLIHLHEQGFGRLRLAAKEGPKGWECSLFPAALIDYPGMGEALACALAGKEPPKATLPDHHRQRWAEALDGLRVQPAVHHAEDTPRFFGIDGSETMDPRHLAERLVRERPVLWSGWGRDERYARWFMELFHRAREAGEPLTDGAPGVEVAFVGSSSRHDGAP